MEQRLCCLVMSLNMLAGFQGGRLGEREGCWGRGWLGERALGGVGRGEGGWGASSPSSEPEADGLFTYCDWTTHLAFLSLCYDESSLPP